MPPTQDVSKRATAAQILKHEWLVKEGVALDIALDSVVLKRLKQFAQMNKLKKACLMVIGQHLTPDEIAGELRSLIAQYASREGHIALLGPPPSAVAPAAHQSKVPDSNGRQECCMETIRPLVVDT